MCRALCTFQTCSGSYWIFRTPPCGRCGEGQSQARKPRPRASASPSAPQLAPSVSTAVSPLCPLFGVFLCRFSCCAQSAGFISCRCENSLCILFRRWAFVCHCHLSLSSPTRRVGWRAAVVEEVRSGVGYPHSATPSPLGGKGLSGAKKPGSPEKGDRRRGFLSVLGTESPAGGHSSPAPAAAGTELPQC